MRQFDETLKKNMENDIEILAAGLSIFDPENDMRVQDVFERADALMYDDKERKKQHSR